MLDELDAVLLTACIGRPTRLPSWLTCSSRKGGVGSSGFGSDLPRREDIRNPKGNYVDPYFTHVLRNEGDLDALQEQVYRITTCVSGEKTMVRRVGHQGLALRIALLYRLL